MICPRVLSRKRRVQREKFIGERYIARLSPIGAHNLMLGVGVVEIVAGLGVAWKPRIFAYVVAAWLAIIIANLLLIPGYFDVALRDFGLFLGALALARLSHQFARSDKR